jgi:hypothetical protein
MAQGFDPELLECAHRTFPETLDVGVELVFGPRDQESIAQGLPWGISPHPNLP